MSVNATVGYRLPAPVNLFNKCFAIKDDIVYMVMLTSTPCLFANLSNARLAWIVCLANDDSWKNMKNRLEK